MNKMYFPMLLIVMLIVIHCGPLDECRSQILSEIRINTSPHPVGSGARATGMGGAFIAVADDATASSWNPGGLIQLETPEISFAGSCDIARGKLDAESHPEISSMNEVTYYDLNYLSGVFPFQVGARNGVISLNYQKLYDLHNDMDFRIVHTGRVPGFPRYVLKDKVRFRQRGSLKAFSPAGAVQLTSRISIGISFNIWTDRLFWENGWTAMTHESFSGIGVTGTTYNSERLRMERYSHFRGFNMNLGLLWNMTSLITVGAVMKTPFRASLHYHYREVQKVHQRVLGRFDQSDASFSEHRKLFMPLSYGLGIAFRWSDTFTLSLDVYRTHWSTFFMEDGQGDETSPLGGIPRRHSHVHDVTQLRMGGEYLIMLKKSIVPFRAGVFYDPQPSQKHPDDVYGWSMGSGMILGQRLLLDAAYQLRYGQKVGGGSIEGVADARVNNVQHRLMFSLIYYF